MALSPYIQLMFWTLTAFHLYTTAQTQDKGSATTAWTWRVFREMYGNKYSNCSSPSVPSVMLGGPDHCGDSFTSVLDEVVHKQTPCVVNFCNDFIEFYGLLKV
ncbi:Uncharacterised protein [uncultured archaeon]|nr:Uncharacterised protein [uncultured archaeon]